jgi:hypothetical protein
VPSTSAVCKRGHLKSTEVVDAINRYEQGAPRSTTGFYAPGLELTRGSGRPVYDEIGQFCDECGAPVLTVCEGCGRAITLPDINASVFGPPSFCKWCGIPFPWATREERIGQLYNLLDFEEGLDESRRLEVVEAIAVLSAPEDSSQVAEKVRAGNLFRKYAPGAWAAGLPVLQSLLSAELQGSLHLK